MKIPNSQPLPLEEAQTRLLGVLKRLDVDTVSLYEAHGRILAEDVIADADVPGFDKSAMDGFAVRAADIQSAAPDNPAVLEVIETVPAGRVPARTVQSGQAIRIMTGAPIPPGADAVVRFEQTRDDTVDGKPAVRILAPVPAGEAIVRRGEDVKAGTAILSSGVRITPAETGILATFGYTTVSVYRQPVVGILSTGSELQPVEKPLEPGKIRDSNSSMLAHLVRQAGGIPVILGQVGDDEDKLVTHLERHLPEIDILATTGGVSVGDYDMMQAVYERLGAEAVFWKCLIRPGMPVLVARKGDKPFFGLSGNPASAFVNAWLFLLPAIRYMQGDASPFPKKVTAFTVESITPQPIKHTRLLRGTAFVEAGQLKVSLAAAQSSGVLSSYLGANCVVRVPGGVQYEAGDLVEVELFSETGSLHLL